MKTQCSGTKQTATRIVCIFAGRWRQRSAIVQLAYLPSQVQGVRGGEGVSEGVPVPISTTF